MENYISEILSICKLPFNETMKDYKVIILGGKCIYISNYIKIIDYSQTRVVLKVKKNTLEITGEDMQISQINKGEIVVVGNVFSCGLGGVGEKK